MKFDSASRRRIDRAGKEFLAAALRFETQRRENTPALIELAHVLTSIGAHEEGLKIDQKLARLCPEDPVVRYNLACSLALVERADDAFGELEKAIDLGFTDVKGIVRDRDLKSLHTDPRFKAIIRRLRERRPQTSRQADE